MKNQVVQTIQSPEWRAGMQLIGFVVILLNMWFLIKIAPVTQQVALIDQRVSSLESESDKSAVVANTVRINNIEQQYNRMEAKIDLLLSQGR